MAIHDFLCPACGTVNENIYVALEDYDTHTETCACGRQMDYDLRSKTKRSTRSIKFPEFTLHHTRRLDGAPEGREIRSLHDVRRFEKDHQDSQVCVEAFSYDTQQHIPEPETTAPSVHASAEARAKFIQKYRDLDI